MTVATCTTVLILLSAVGRMSLVSSRRRYSMLPTRMKISRLITMTASQHTVERVGRSANGEDQERRLAPAGDQQEGEERDQEDPGRRQPVGDVDQSRRVEAVSGGRWNHSSLSISDRSS